IFGFDTFSLFLSNDLIARTIGTVININILLAVFNLLPIPPLDGSKIFSLALPPKEAHAYMSLGSFGMIILFMLLLIPLGPFSLLSIVSALRLSFLTLLGFS